MSLGCFCPISWQVISLLKTTHIWLQCRFLLNYINCALDDPAIRDYAHVNASNRKTTPEKHTEAVLMLYCLRHIPLMVNLSVLNSMKVTAGLYLVNHLPWAVPRDALSPPQSCPLLSAQKFSSQILDKTKWLFQWFIQIVDALLQLCLHKDNRAQITFIENSWCLSSDASIGLLSKPFREPTEYLHWGMYSKI